MREEGVVKKLNNYDLSWKRMLRLDLVFEPFFGSSLFSPLPPFLLPVLPFSPFCISPPFWPSPLSFYEGRVPS